MSFTISYSNPPCNGQDLLNGITSIGNQNNNFTVSQSMAGIVNSGSESCASLSVSGLSSLSGGVSVVGTLTLPSQSISDSALSSNIPLKNGLNTFSAVNTFSSAPVMSGASISANSIPALSIVNDSINDSQIALGGIGQSSVADGYVNLVSAQSIVGVKNFSSGLSGILTGSLVGNADSATVCQTVNILTDNTAGIYFIPFLKTNGATSDSLFVDDVSVPVLSYNPSTGAFTAGSIVTSAGITCGGLTSSNGLVVSNGNISLQSPILLPVAQTTLTIVAGVVTVNLNNASLNEFILPSVNFVTNITSMVFTNALTTVNSKFNIYIQGGAANRTINKNLGAAQVNTLSGNTQISALSTWRCVGTVLSSTLVSLQFTNFT